MTLSPSNSAPPPRLHTPSRRQSRPPISPSKKHKYEKTTKDLRDGVGPAREDIINRIFVFSPSTPSVCRRVHRLAESHFGTVFTHFTTHERRERGGLVLDSFFVTFCLFLDLFCVTEAARKRLFKKTAFSVLINRKSERESKKRDKEREREETNKNKSILCFSKQATSRRRTLPPLRQRYLAD